MEKRRVEKEDPNEQTSATAAEQDRREGSLERQASVEKPEPREAGERQPKHKRTSEEKALDAFFEEVLPEFSEPVRTVLDEAWQLAFSWHLFDVFVPQDGEIEEAEEKIRLAAIELTEGDCELLKEFVRRALTAAVSIDPFDYETIVDRRSSCSDLHDYYMHVSGLVKRALSEYRHHKYMAARRESVDDSRDNMNDNLPF